MKKISKTDWSRVDSMTDVEIDYSDSPEMAANLFKLMTKEEPEKIAVSLSLDPEIINFSKEHRKK
jgi:hypothetical protein